MSYTPYVTVEEYAQILPDGVTVTTSDLMQASRHIDSLTFNRIVDIGFDELSDFQQEIVQEVVARQAAFEVENAELISAALASYSINGVSMSFDSNNWSLKTEAGVAIRRDLYALLIQTGLCCRVVG